MSGATSPEEDGVYVVSVVTGRENEDGRTVYDRSGLTGEVRFAVADGKAAELPQDR